MLGWESPTTQRKQWVFRMTLKRPPLWMKCRVTKTTSPCGMTDNAVRQVKLSLCPLPPWAAEASTHPQIGKALAVSAHGRPATPASQTHEPWEVLVLPYGCFSLWHVCRNTHVSGRCVVEEVQCCRFKHVQGGALCCRSCTPLQMT